MIEDVRRRLDRGELPEDGVTLPEGTAVTVIADGETGAFKTTPEEERELLR